MELDVIRPVRRQIGLDLSNLRRPRSLLARPDEGAAVDLLACWQRQPSQRNPAAMTQRSACSYRKVVALVLAGSFPSEAWVLEPATRTPSAPIAVPRHQCDANNRLRAKCARPPLRAESTRSETHVVDDESHLRPSWETDLTRDDLQELLETAQEAARAAGTVILSHLGCCSQSESSQEECEIKYSIKDIVTQYDQQAQQVIKDIVLAKFPTHRFLGEEDVGAGGAASQAALEAALRSDSINSEVASSSKSPFLWICDPIDGTANFASGLELCAVTMGIAYEGTPVVGVVYDPHRDHMYSAIRHQGATCNGQPIAVSPSTMTVDEAIINAGCPADPNAFAASIRGIVALNRRCRGVRMVACSALTLAWIASGKLSAHFGYDLSSWDLIAGALLVQEAGGRITDLDGTPYRLETRSMLCSNALVHDEILNILTDADAVSFTRSL